MSFIDDDLAVVFSASNPLTEAATVTGVGTVYGLYDEAYTPTSPTGGDYQNTTPSFVVNASSYATHVNTDTAVIRSTTYKIRRREIMDDGKTARLILGVD